MKNRPLLHHIRIGKNGIWHGIESLFGEFQPSALVLCACTVLCGSTLHAQPSPPFASSTVPTTTDSPTLPPPFNPFSRDPAASGERKRLAELATADRRRMMDLLAVSEPATLPPPAEDPQRPANTRPVPDRPNNWTDGIPGHAIVRSIWGHWINYDPAKAEVGRLPDPLALKNGEPVSDAATWWNRRRPEILADFQTEIYGRIPTDSPRITWEIISTDAHAFDGTVNLKHLIGRIDNTRYPAAVPYIELSLYLPVNVTGPVPVLVTLIYPGFSDRPSSDVPTPLQQVLAHGWGYATYTPNTVQADSGGGLNRGIIGLVNRGQSRQPDDWGSIAAWSWGLSRVIDYFETDHDVDAKRLGIEGHSRYGKTALVAAAYEPRWSIVYASCSGEGGAKLHRHDLGESVDNVCSSSEYHWMAGNFLKYAGRWDALPIDQHELIALIAPRPVFVTGGTQDLWADPLGEFKACVAAGPVYRLLGKKDLGQIAMPAPDQALISGDLAFRLHEGGHTDTLDWPTFLKFADRYFIPPLNTK